MKVLFVTLYPLEVNTSVTKSNYGLIKGFVDRGDDITILMPENITGDAIVSKYIDTSKIKIIRIKNKNIGSYMAKTAKEAKGIKQKIFSIIRRIYNKFSIFDRTKAFIKEVKSINGLDEYYDIMISTSDPKTSHIFANKLLKKRVIKCGKWIQHWGDPLVNDVSSKKIHPQRCLRKVEFNIINKPNTIIYVSPFTLIEQQRNYSKLSRKMKFVPLPSIELDNKDLIQKDDIQKISACYVGAYLSHIRNILPLYNACKKSQNISLTIAGITDIKLDETENIRILPRVTQEEASKIELDSDILISVCNLKGTQIPGKIYYFSSLNKPILIILDGDYINEMKNYFESFNRYTLCINEESSIIDALNKISMLKGKTFDTPIDLRPINVANKIVEVTMENEKL